MKKASKLNSILMRRVAARKWMEHGAKVLPLTAKGKAPVAGYSSRKAFASVSDMRAFLSTAPDSNYGIVTGADSGLVVLDVDGKVGEGALRDLIAKHKALPATVVVRTGNGYHHYFRHTGEPISGRVGYLGSGLDIRANGNYVVGPGSVHENGKPYRYVDKTRKYDPAPLPDWLLRLMTGGAKTPEPVSTSSAVAAGARNSHLTSVAGKLHNTGIGGAALLAALNATNVAECDPPLDDQEVRAIALSVGRYPITLAGRDPADAVATALLQDGFAGGDNLIYAADGQFWTFDCTRWAPLGKEVLRGMALNAIKSLPDQRTNSAALMGQVEALLRAQVAASGDLLRFQGNPLPVINCRNGEVWLAADGRPELRPHAAKSYLRQRLEVDYDPAAKCPLFDRALAGIFAKSGSPKEMANFWHELSGYVIQPNRPIPIIVVCRGQGRNGKTSLVQTLTQLLGHDLVSATRVEELNRSQFSTAQLLGKLLFVDDDVKSGTRLPDGDLKRISEGKLISAERKFGEQFNFIVRTVPMLLCNNPPSLSDLSEGMQRRLVVIPFDRTFSEEEIDRTLFERIWAAELPGILNHAISGWQRVVARGLRFELPTPVAEAKSVLLQAANPVPAFIEMKCTRSGRCSAAMLYSAFQSWSTSQGYTLTQTQPQFKRNVQNLGFKQQHANTGDVFVGLSLADT